MPPPVSRRAHSMVRMTMADMAELADKRPGSFRLENADTDLPPPAHAIRATRDAVGQDRYNSYLPLHGLPELREAISERYRADLGLHYDPDGEVDVTSGVGEAMLDVLLSYVNEGDRVLMTNPTYNGMAQRVRLAGGVQVFTNQLESKGWHLDPSDLRRAAKGCRVIFYGSPSMPTGVIFSRDEMAVIAEAAVENDALIVFNGAVDKVVFDGKAVINPATLPGLRERSITVGCVTKNYNMVGWRIGWAVGPRDLLKPIHAIFSSIYAVANKGFYLMVFVTLMLVFAVIYVTRWLDYWEVLPNEILHHHGPLSDLERYPTMNLKFDKEIPDVLEYGALGAGRLVLHVTDERKSIVLDNVPANDILPMLVNLLAKVSGLLLVSKRIFHVAHERERRFPILARQIFVNRATVSISSSTLASTRARSPT